MSTRVLCPKGHKFSIADQKLGSVVVCPECSTAFKTKGAVKGADKGAVKAKPKKSDDEDEVVIEIVDEKEAVTAKPRAVEKPAKKKPRTQDDDDAEKKSSTKPRKPRKVVEDEDEDDEVDEEEEEEDEIEWNRKKRQLAKVNVGIMAYTISGFILGGTYVLMGTVEIPFLYFAVIGHLNPRENKPDLGSALFFLGVMMLIGLIGMVPVFICHIVGWITGLMSPPRAEARSLCLTALILFFSPILIYLLYLFFWGAVIEREEVGQRMLSMFHGLTFLLMMLAYYCSLVYIGRIAGFINLNTEKRKPQAVGWFIVGGTLLLGGCLVAADSNISIWAIYITGALDYAIFYFVIIALMDLNKSLVVIRAAIDEHIKYT